MTERVYISSTQKATFVCPKCQKSKTVDVSKYAVSGKTIKVNIKCPCGYAFTTVLEKRKRYRKQTNLPGSYHRYDAGKQMEGGLMTVRDLSTTGMGLRINEDHNLEPGDVIVAEFHTDDAQRAFIKKKAVVRSVKGPIIGTEFAPMEREDKALGFYLLK